MKSVKVGVGVGLQAFPSEDGKYEAENCIAVGAITFRTASTNETIVNSWPKGASLVLAFKASAAGTYTFAFNGRAGGSSSYSTTNTVLADEAVIEVNGVQLAVEGTVSGRTFTDYPLGEINVVEGLNIISWKNLKTGPAIDYFTLVAKA